MLSNQLHKYYIHHSHLSCSWYGRTFSRWRQSNRIWCCFADGTTANSRSVELLQAAPIPLMWPLYCFSFKCGNRTWKTSTSCWFTSYCSTSFSDNGLRQLGHFLSERVNKGRGLRTKCVDISSNMWKFWDPYQTFAALDRSILRRCCERSSWSPDSCRSPNKCSTWTLLAPSPRKRQC